MHLRRFKERLMLSMKQKSYQHYLYKMVMSNILIALIPICILGGFWYSMIVKQAMNKFHQQKAIELNEIVSGINQRIKTLTMELAVESQESKYSSYKFSDNYNVDLKKIINRLNTMTKKYYLLHSMYFYDTTTDKIYTSLSGSYPFHTFYDINWLKDTKDICTIQQLPLRYAFNNTALDPHKEISYGEYNKLVLSLVIKGRPDFYLVANINIHSLYQDILSFYDINDSEDEFFFLNTDHQLIEGACNYIPEHLLFELDATPIEKDVSYINYNDRIFFFKTLDSGILCVTSYSSSLSYQEAQYLSKYVILVCVLVLLFLVVISNYVAKRLYQPINTLYSEISENAKALQGEHVSDEIEMLKRAFKEMNILNSNAQANLKQFNEINNVINFRNYLEKYRSEDDFLLDHPYLFEKDHNNYRELLLLKLDFANMKMNTNEEMLFQLNLHEVLRTYLQSAQKGILTKIANDNLVLLYASDDMDGLLQTRKVLTDTVTKLTNFNTFFVISNRINTVDEIVPQYNKCLDLLETSYFFNWKNEIVSMNQLNSPDNGSDIYMNMLNINASFIRNIVSQNQSEIDLLFDELGKKFNQLRNVSQVKDVCNHIIVDLDHEFHFSNSLDINLLQSLNNSKTLIDTMNFMKKLINSTLVQYRNNDAKEINYCESAKKYLDEHYLYDMNITDVADHLNISYSYLSKIFRSITGETLTDYLNRVRIEKSKEYLSNTFLTLNEISEKVGYNNAQSYQRFFKRYVNITPGDYRKLHNKPTLL